MFCLLWYYFSPRSCILKEPFCAWALLICELLLRIELAVWWSMGMDRLLLSVMSFFRLWLLFCDSSLLIRFFRLVLFGFLISNLRWIGSFKNWIFYLVLARKLLLFLYLWLALVVLSRAFSTLEILFFLLLFL